MSMPNNKSTWLKPIIITLSTHLTLDDNCTGKPTTPVGDGRCAGQSS